MTDRGNGLATASIETVAGLSAGLVSTAIVHPLDIIKTRLQVDSSPRSVFGSSFTILRNIFRNEGPTHLAALYRGLTPNLVGNSASWALYFLWYGQAQDLIRTYRGYGPDTHLSSVDYLAASAASGLLTAFLTNPVWVVKTRMLTTSATQRGAYPSMWSGLASIWRTEGFRGYFHGMVPAMAGISHGSAYFVAYEKLKFWRKRSKSKSHSGPGNAHSAELTNLDTIINSSLSKTFAGVLTYPHQVIRARMQTYDPAAISAVRRRGMTDLIRGVWKHEGLFGFYKGLGPNLLRVVPSTCVTFLVYENVRWGLPRLMGERERNQKKEKAVMD